MMSRLNVSWLSLNGYRRELATNHLEKLVELYSGEEWNTDALSENPSTTLKMVEDNIDEEWDFNNLYELNIEWPQRFFCHEYSKCPTLTWQDVLDRPDINWNYAAISWNPSITWGIIRANQVDAHGVEIPWNYSNFSSNQNVTMKIVAANPDIPWDYDNLAINPSITWKDVLEHQFDGHGRPIPWRKAYLSANPSVPWDVVFSDVPVRSDDGHVAVDEWDYQELSKRVDTATFLANMDRPWHYPTLSKNPNISMAAVRAKPDARWCRDYLAANPSITWEDVMDNPVSEHLDSIDDSIGWDYAILSENPNITLDIIRAYPFGAESKMDSVIVATQLSSPFGGASRWCWDHFSRNPSLTWRIVRDNPDIPWDFEWISQNAFNRDPFVRKRLEKKAAEEDVLIAGVAEALGGVFPLVLCRIILEMVFFLDES